MFKNARIKLTAWYLLIIMLISIAFSVVIYEELTREVERFARMHQSRIERQLIHERELLDPDHFQYAPPNNPIIDKELVQETNQRIILILVIINGVIFVISGGLGYFLAGKTLKPIKDMVDEQNLFISDASHELRTPLTSLKTAMEVSLRNKKLSLVEAKTLISDSVGEVNKLQILSDRLLQLAQYQKPNGNMRLEKISLIEVVKEAIKKIKPLAEQKQITINSKIEDYEIDGNKYGLIDLFIIVLDNAIKYSPKLTTVIISIQKTDRSVVITIKDQGIGIDKKDLPHIFDRFYRADTARSKNDTDGFGLGLSIAKKIVDFHHGSITVKSEEKKGSTFIISLPIRKLKSIS